MKHFPPNAEFLLISIFHLLLMQHQKGAHILVFKIEAYSH